MAYANNFSEILSTLAEDNDLRLRVSNLIQTRPIHGKAIEETNRVAEFRNILADLVNARLLTLNSAFQAVENRLPRAQSQYVADNRVFATGWAERLVRVQLSRFYNQALLELLNEQGETQCFVPISNAPNRSPQCAVIENHNYRVSDLLRNILNNYENEQYDNSLKIPEHPHCTHVVKPIE